MSLQDAKNKIRALFAKIKLRAAIKKLSVALMIVSIALANTPMSYTVAKLVDTEVSGDNIFSAGTLDQSLSSGADFSPAVLPGSVVATKDMAIANNGSLGFHYTIFATNTIGALCDSLNLQATLDGVSVYNGQLKLFSYEVADYSSTTDNWHFEASLPSGAAYTLQNQTCNLDFNVLAKQKDLASGVGFSDLETMSNAIFAGAWKIEGIWVQTTVADFNAGQSSYDCCGKKEIAISSASDGTGDVSIAAGGEVPPQTASFSGNNDGQHIPGKAIDGDAATYWKATQASNADWFGVDYGMLYPVAKIEIDFHHPHIPEKYRVEISPTCAYTGEQTMIKSSSHNHSDFLTIEFAETMIKCARIVFLDTNGNPAIDEFTSFKRELPWFDGTATLTSQTFDSGKITKWAKLEWDETLADGADIAFSVQTSNDGATWSPWQLKSSTSPIDLSTLPQTRFIRWKADLTSDTYFPPITTPILHEARVFYEQEDAQKFVVLNEYLPNPDGSWGDDTWLKPKGEWIELYNNGSSAVDLDGFYFQNALGTKKYISKATAFITTNTGDTVINSHDWLVVYMNGEFMSNSGDTIAFYDLFGNPVDSHAFDTTNACNLLPTPDATNSTAISGDCATVPANKSFARIPDGTGAWVDPIPTPGSANVLEVVPVDEFVDKLNDLLVTPTSSEATTTQETAELPMESTGGSAPTPEAIDTLPIQSDLGAATSSEEIATTSLPASTEAINAPELATSTPEIIPETAPATTTPSVEDAQAATTTTTETIIEPAASVPAPAPVVAEVSTPLEPQPAIEQTQTEEVLQEAPANPDPQPSTDPAPEALPSATQTPAPSEPAPEATPSQTTI